MIIDAFRFYSKALSNLPAKDKKQIVSIEFCYRDDKLSVVASTRDYETLKRLVRFLPEEIDPNADLFSVDLESLSTNTIRIYWTHKHDEENIARRSIYINQLGEVIERKKHYRVDDEDLLKVEVFNTEDLYEIDEIECDAEEWPGPKEIIDMAKLLGINTICLKRPQTNESYLRLIGKI